MADTFTFPKGYDVTVCRKQDILDCIDRNIIDKDIALAIVEHCEFTAAEYIKAGRWTGLPYIGNIRKSPRKVIINSEESKALMKEAQETLDQDKLVVFRKTFNSEVFRQIRTERYYKYMTSIAVRSNRAVYDKLCKTKGDVFARVYLFCSYHLADLHNEYNVIDNQI